MWAHLPIADRSPWPIQVGAILQGCVASVKPYGLFVRLDGFRANGLVHSSQVGICWLNRDANSYAVLKAVWTSFRDRRTMPCQLLKAHQSMMWARGGCGEREANGKVRAGADTSKPCTVVAAGPGCWAGMLGKRLIKH